MQLTPKLILGTFGDDVLDGTKNRDLIVGLTGDDTAFGFNGDDILIGGEGNDHLLAGNGNDFLTGGSGRDRLNGGQGHDTLSGDDGDDGIVGGRGNDLLIGGGGDDKFRFNPHRSDEGHDTIKDFTLGEDKIFLKVGDVIASTPGLVDAIIANGGDAAGTFKALDDSADWELGANRKGDLVITHPNGTITLKGIPATGINSFADAGAAIAVGGLGEALTGLAEASGNPETIADLVALSGGTPDNNNDDFDLLLTALNATGLTSALADEDGSFSVFAPTDAAFISLAERLGFSGSGEADALDFILDTLGDLNGNDDPLPLLEDVLLLHVAGGARTLGELQLNGSIKTLLGDRVSVDGNTIVDGEPDLSDAQIIAADIQTGNGVVQVIDEVLLFDI